MDDASFRPMEIVKSAELYEPTCMTWSLANKNVMILIVGGRSLNFVATFVTKDVI